MNPYDQPSVMNYALSEDVKALIDVREVPQCKLVERQFQLHAFGFVFWLNTRRCTLTKVEKQILTDFRLSRFNYRILFRHRKKTIDAVYSELQFVAKKLYEHYPLYQSWLMDQSRYTYGWLRNTNEFQSYLVLNLPLEKLTIPKAIIEGMRKEKYRSLHEMLLKEDERRWKRLIDSPKDLEWFCQFAHVHGFSAFLGLAELPPVHTKRTTPKEQRTVSKALSKQLASLKGNIRTLFLHRLFRSFGVVVNAKQFEQLAHHVTWAIIRKHRNNLDDMEAILYGQAGLLPEIPVDGYSADLRYRYDHFKQVYNLEPMNPEVWKFVSATGDNYPTVRISQLATVFYNERDLFERCMSSDVDLDNLRPMFDVAASWYWEDHCRFGIYSPKKEKRLSEYVVNSVLGTCIKPVRVFAKE